MQTEARRIDPMKRVPANRFVIFFLLASAGLFWDLLSKQTVLDDLGYPGVAGQHVIFSHPPGSEGQSIEYLSGWVTFSLYSSFNEGALWGVGQGFAWLFAGLSVLAVVGVIYWLFVRGAAISLWLTISLACIMAGTLGNLYDRMAWHGCLNPVTGEPWQAVRDFLLFTFGGWPWPVFNFADVFLVTGAIMLVLHSFQAELEGDEIAKQSKSARREVTAADVSG